MIQKPLSLRFCASSLRSLVDGQFKLKLDIREWCEENLAPGWVIEAQVVALTSGGIVADVKLPTISFASDADAVAFVLRWE